MKNKLLTIVSFSLLSMPFAASAADNPLSASVKMQYGMAKANLMKAADKMPDADYSYKPTDSVRSYGQIVGHVANANYMFCSAALGEKSPQAGNIEKTKTTKADLVQALKESYAYCDKAYDAMTDTMAVETVKLFGNEVPKLGVLTFNNMHDFEHYGNIVTYLRMRNLVPPSSEPRK